MTSSGGRFALKDNGETPDTQDALFEYPGWTATWSQRECSRGAAPTNGLEFCGTRGSLTISRRGFVVTPDPKIAPADAIPRFGRRPPVGGPVGTGSRESPVKWTDSRRGSHRRRVRPVPAPRPATSSNASDSRRDPISDLEGGHRVVTACHLANLSLRLGRKLRWDAERETIIDDPEAEVMLERPYRSPWDRELKTLMERGDPCE